jgi:tetratricopeptide (TPR) repeat protein
MEYTEVADMTDRDLLWFAFLWSAWGPSPERDRDLKDLEAAALQRSTSPELFARFSQACSEGRQAWRMEQELTTKLRDCGGSVTRDWLDAQAGSLPPRVMKHLQLCLKKESEKRRSRTETGGDRACRSMVRFSLVNGQHPNVLRLQEPSSHWCVYIDETGSNFDETAPDFADDHKVGRIVALAVPGGTLLPPLDGFHAADVGAEKVDDVLQRVLDSKIGILGFSVVDPSARHRYWIGHVLHLVRWTLLQLPVSIGTPNCRVEILIERRDSYQVQTDLTVVSRALESEMGRIDPERYAGLALDLRFMTKDDPMNGYVDAVAFTWGSPSKASKARLRQSGLLGNCLVVADEIGLHHLYIALSQDGDLPPVDWYRLCAAAAEDAPDGFLGRALDRLGQKTQRTPLLWQGYLAEVQTRLQSKTYDLIALGHAITWLKEHAAQGRTLPGVLQLQLNSSNLALANHRGQIDKGLVMACLQSIQDLHDEAPQMACEALLRMVVATTNSFEFGALEQVIADRLAQPVAVAGLLNYGKLQSSRGQILAFQGHWEQSLSCFDGASVSFQRLSDPAQASREMRQTRIYRLIAKMDNLRRQPQVDRSGIITELTEFFAGHSPTEISQALAKSGHAKRFEQHLWLRAMNCFPEELAEARRAYLRGRPHWVTGESHPWALILAYRGWLLRDEGRLAEAGETFEMAIDLCLEADHGLTLLWMAAVLHRLGLALGLELATEFVPASSHARLKTQLPRAPHLALSAFTQETARDHESLLLHLESCLPFNFH